MITTYTGLMRKTNPVYMNPNEIFDGAIVNGCCVIASDKKYHMGPPE